MIARTVLILAAGCFVSSGDATKKDVDRMQGEWKPVNVIINGERLKDDISKDRLTIKGKTFVLKSGGMDMEGTFVLDASKTPPFIDTEMVGPDKKPFKSVGIYELDGDTMKVCYAVAPRARPNEFKAEAASLQALVVYQRVGK